MIPKSEFCSLIPAQYLTKMKKYYKIELAKFYDKTSDQKIKAPFSVSGGILCSL